MKPTNENKLTLDMVSRVLDEAREQADDYVTRAAAEILEGSPSRNDLVIVAAFYDSHVR